MTTTTTNGATPAMTVFWENVRTIVYALMLAMAIRFTIAQPFRIPSSSMVPTLEVGDYIVVTKWSFGYSRYSFAPLEGILPEGRLFGSEPKLGEVVVFRPPTNPDRDFIKRVVGLPGDTVQMIGGVLHINGTPVQREDLGVVQIETEGGAVIDVNAYRETLPNDVTYTTFEQADNDGRLDNTDAYTVPEGHFFMMGDNRDNSSDSRVQFGEDDGAARDNCAGSTLCFVPRDNLVGPAQFVVVSFDNSTKIFKPWTLFTGFRTERFLKPVD